MQTYSWKTPNWKPSFASCPSDAGSCARSSSSRPPAIRPVPPADNCSNLEPNKPKRKIHKARNPKSVPKFALVGCWPSSAFRPLDASTFCRIHPCGTSTGHFGEIGPRGCSTVAIAVQVWHLCDGPRRLPWCPFPGVDRVQYTKTCTHLYVDGNRAHINRFYQLLSSINFEISMEC